jgi:type I restriction enzyme S subunit
MKYQRYPAYKASGVEMLGDLPSHWNEKQVRFLLKDGAEGIKIGPFGSALKLEDMVESGIRVYGQENVISKDFSLGKRMISDDKFKEMRVYQIYPNDLLMTMMGTSGKCELVPDDIDLGIIDSHLLRLRVNESEILPRFFRLLIDECYEVENQIKVLGKGSIMHGLNSSIVKELRLPLPNLDEQEHILNFLDYETAKIDTLIEKQRRLIELLKEKRQAVISHAVTKGLNPTLPMKDSGVEWLGEVPEHWILMHFRRITHLQQGLQIPQENRYSEEGESRVEYITIKSINAGVDRIHKEFIYSPSARVVCNEKDVLLARTGATGEVVTNVSGAFHNNFFKINYDENKITRDYLVYFLKVNEIKNHLVMLAGTTTIPDLNHGAFLGTLICLPSITEQNAIVSYLENKSKGFQKLEERTNKAIELMQERRTALISAAVTGKIDVRHWQVSE